jgi:hypothetical protein
MEQLLQRLQIADQAAVFLFKPHERKAIGKALQIRREQLRATQGK